MEAALIDGAGRCAIFRRITLPLIWDSVQVAFVYLGIAALDGFALVQIMTVGPGGPDNSTEVMGLALYRNAFTYGKFGYASRDGRGDLLPHAVARRAAAAGHPAGAGGAGMRDQARLGAARVLRLGRAGHAAAAVGGDVVVQDRRGDLRQPVVAARRRRSATTGRGPGSRRRSGGTCSTRSIVVGGALVLTMLLGALIAYCLARYEFPGNRVIYYTLVAGMLFPVFLALVPLFFVVRQPRACSAPYHGLILVYAAYALPFTVFFLHAFFRTLPDRGRRGRVHRRLLARGGVLPGHAADGPARAWSASASSTSSGCGTSTCCRWCSTRIPDRYVLAQGLAALAVSQGYRSDWSGLFAGLIIAILPVLLGLRPLPTADPRRPDRRRGEVTPTWRRAARRTAGAATLDRRGPRTPHHGPSPARSTMMSKRHAAVAATVATLTALAAGSGHRRRRPGHGRRAGRRCCQVLFDDFTYSGPGRPADQPARLDRAHQRRRPGRARRLLAGLATSRSRPSTARSRCSCRPPPTARAAAPARRSSCTSGSSSRARTPRGSSSPTRPVTGTDGDHLVETFFTITPLNAPMDPNYGEIDFEYLPNGGWGEPSNIFYETTWETYRPDPWEAVNTHTEQRQSLRGLARPGVHRVRRAREVLRRRRAGRRPQRHLLPRDTDVDQLQPVVHRHGRALRRHGHLPPAGRLPLPHGERGAHPGAGRRRGSRLPRLRRQPTPTRSARAAAPARRPRRPATRPPVRRRPSRRPSPSPTPTPTGGTGCANAPFWNINTVYHGRRPACKHERSANGNPGGPPSGDGVHLWRARWWTQGSEPGWTQQWEDLAAADRHGRCS